MSADTENRNAHLGFGGSTSPQYEGVVVVNVPKGSTVSMEVTLHDRTKYPFLSFSEKFLTVQNPDFTAWRRDAPDGSAQITIAFFKHAHGEINLNGSKAAFDTKARPPEPSAESKVLDKAGEKAILKENSAEKVEIKDAVLPKTKAMLPKEVPIEPTPIPVVEAKKEEKTQTPPTGKVQTTPSGQITVIEQITKDTQESGKPERLNPPTLTETPKPGRNPRPEGTNGEQILKPVEAEKDAAKFPPGRFEENGKFDLHHNSPLPLLALLLKQPEVARFLGASAPEGAPPSLGQPVPRRVDVVTAQINNLNDLFGRAPKVIVQPATEPTVIPKSDPVEIIRHGPEPGRWTFPRGVDDLTEQYRHLKEMVEKSSWKLVPVSNTPVAKPPTELPAVPASGEVQGEALVLAPNQYAVKPLAVEATLTPSPSSKLPIGNSSTPPLAIQTNPTSPPQARQLPLSPLQAQEKLLSDLNKQDPVTAIRKIAIATNILQNVSTTGLKDEDRHSLVPNLVGMFDSDLQKLLSVSTADVGTLGALSIETFKGYADAALMMKGMELAKPLIGQTIGRIPGANYLLDLLKTPAGGTFAVGAGSFLHGYLNTSNPDFIFNPELSDRQVAGAVASPILTGAAFGSFLGPAGSIVGGLAGAGGEVLGLITAQERLEEQLRESWFDRGIRNSILLSEQGYRSSKPQGELTTDEAKAIEKMSVVTILGQVFQMDQNGSFKNFTSQELQAMGFVLDTKDPTAAATNYQRLNELLEPRRNVGVLGLYRSHSKALYEDQRTSYDKLDRIRNSSIDYLKDQYKHSPRISYKYSEDSSYTGGTLEEKDFRTQLTFVKEVLATVQSAEQQWRGSNPNATESELARKRWELIAEQLPQVSRILSNEYQRNSLFGMAKTYGDGSFDLQNSFWTMLNSMDDKERTRFITAMPQQEQEALKQEALTRAKMTLGGFVPQQEVNADRN